MDCIRTKDVTATKVGDELMAGVTDNIKCPFGSEWKVIREIGRGSYGSVYLIEREIGDEIIQSAMKVICLPASDDEPEQIMNRTGRSREEVIKYYQSLGDALLPEIQLMSKLRGDSHIVSYEDHAVIPHDSGIGMDIYIRMEYLETLPHWLGGRQLTNGNVVQLGIQLCEGLETCAHSKIVHRDIKPANIFVAKNGAFKLGDFGIAQKLDAYVDAEDRKLGSLNYIAPEVKRGETFDERVDIYGLGMVMYRILNDGRIPFLPAAPSTYTEEQEERARQKRLGGEKLPKPAHCCDVLWAVIEKACSYHPDGRYNNAIEMSKALKAISFHPDMSMPLPVENERRRDSDTSPRTRSTGPNGTGRRKHTTDTPSPLPPKESSLHAEKENNDSNSNKDKAVRLPKIAIIAGAAFIILVATVIVVLNVTGTQRSLNVSVKKGSQGIMILEIEDGKSPYHLAVINEGLIVDEYGFDSRTAGIDNLVPGITYDIQIVDSRKAESDVEITMPEGLAYNGSDLHISSMIVYECDRQALAESDWLTLSGKNRVKRVTEDGIILRNASAAGQSSQWYALIHAKGGQGTEDAVDALLALRLPNGVVVSETIQLNVSDGAYMQTPIDLDSLLEKAWKACGQWIPGSAVLELYTQGQFLKEEPITLAGSTQTMDGGN